MKLHLALLLTTLILLGGCSSDAPTPGELTTFAAVCDPANEGKRLALEGYFELPESISGDLSAVMRLFETDERIGTPVGSSISFGDGPNTMNQVPNQYSNDDLKFRTNDGATLGYQDKVRLSGTMYFPSSIATVEFKCGLSNPLIEKATN